ncbi:MAG: BamA/TamA family outer membrane protein [Aquabacterium sp.]|uniref:autotransporter assembly complex protein TamA n=1 Tax=Aquabacterium sp. TaxID=1872578 RepID=UPI002A3626BE|nr:BamA/TamA family outer membrane protein [Aquabacterium sp.]MDX9842781.1 BamA/TamA family outer membrane protein [Aquabacterium sp.]
MSQLGSVKPGLWPAIALWLSAVPLCATAQGAAPPGPVSPLTPSAPTTPVSPAPAASAPEVEDADAAPATVVTPRRRLPPLVWQLKVDAPEPLDTLLTQHLELARFQRELVGNDALRISRNELRRLVISAPDEARSLLEAEGYFGAQITTRVDDEVEGKPVVVTLKVVPGERTRISKVQMIYEGALDVALSDGDPRAQSLVDRLAAEWGLPVGEVFRQSVWSSAKNGALARLRAQGYPTASWSGTSVTVDATARTAKIFLVADSGPGFVFGDIRVEGLHRQPASAVLNLAPFKKGDPYEEKMVLDWQERIQKLNLFENIFVTTGFDPTQADATPVVVQLRELPLQAATVGVGASSDTGPRVSGEHLHRNAWGLGWQAKTSLQIGKRESRGQLDLTSHPWPGRVRGLVSGQASRLLDSDDAETSSQRVRVGVLEEGELHERTHYLAYQHARVTSRDQVVVSNASALSGTTQWIWRHVDNQVLPTKGFTSLAELTLGQTYSALNDTGTFLRAYGRVTAYQPLPADWHLTARAEAGQVTAGDAVSVPDTLLFRAGGDDSVRGYAYRSLGVTREGVITGGRALATGSVELAHPIVKRMPSLLGAVFVDVGDAAERMGDLRPNVGYGVGVRWRSPVGMLRLDLARGTETGQFRVHFSVGISL